VHLDQALPLIQQSLSSAPPDETLISAVFYVMLTEASFGEFRKLNNHLRGLAMMWISIAKQQQGELSSLMHYIAESAAYLDSFAGLLGWPLAIPNCILPRNSKWLKHLMVTPESEPWIILNLKTVRCQREVARYSYWAKTTRERADYIDKDERKIVEEGNKLLRKLVDWQTQIPPYYEEPQLETLSDDDFDTTSSRRFLGYRRYQFETPLHAEMHLLFYTLILITYFIRNPRPGSFAKDRVAAAIQFCQCLAAMGESPSSLGPEARTFGQFYCRLVFDDVYPEGSDPSRFPSHFVA
jgi:hypothetical protein